MSHEQAIYQTKLGLAEQEVRMALLSVEMRHLQKMVDALSREDYCDYLPVHSTRCNYAVSKTPASTHLVERGYSHRTLRLRTVPEVEIWRPPSDQRHKVLGRCVRQFCRIRRSVVIQVVISSSLPVAVGCQCARPRTLLGCVFGATHKGASLI